MNKFILTVIFTLSLNSFADWFQKNKKIFNQAIENTLDIKETRFRKVKKIINNDLDHFVDSYVSDLMDISGLELVEHQLELGKQKARVWSKKGSKITCDKKTLKTCLVRSYDSFIYVITINNKIQYIGHSFILPFEHLRFNLHDGVEQEHLIFTGADKGQAIHENW